MFGLGMFRPVEREYEVAQAVLMARAMLNEAWQAMPSPLDRRPEARGAVSEVKFDEMLADGAIE